MKPHTMQKLAFTTKSGVMFYGADEFFAKPDAVDAVICLTETYIPSTIKTYGTGIFENYTYEITLDNPNTLHLPIRDMDVPVYPLALFKKLYNEITTNEDIKTVLVYCAGGSGRTGTVLAVFALLAKTIAWGSTKKYEPIKTGNEVIINLRKMYKQSAIENAIQQQYVLDVAEQLGYPVTEMKSEFDPWFNRYHHFGGYYA